MFLSKTERFFFRFRPLVHPEGPCALKRISEPEKIENVLKIYFCCGFNKPVFVENGPIFAIFFVFALGAPFWGCALKILSRLQARNGPKMLENWIFPVLGAVLGETPADQNLIAR